MRLLLSSAFMDELVKKLEGLGVPSDVLSGLKEKLGDNFVTDIQSLGLKGAAEKAGIDVSALPEIDMVAISNFGKEVMGTDVDGDGKTGIADATTNLKEAVTSNATVQSATEKVEEMKERGGRKSV